MGINVKREDVCLKQAEASPSPAKTPMCAVELEDYEKRMNALLAQIHKVGGEWNRKSREFNLAVVKSKHNKMTAGSQVQIALEEVIEHGNEKVKKIDNVETMYHTGKFIEASEVQDAKGEADEIYELIKHGNKLKLFRGGYTISALVVYPTCRWLNMMLGIR